MHPSRHPIIGLSSDTQNQYGMAFQAASEVLDNPIRRGWLARYVCGHRLGLKVSFHDGLQGWKIKVRGIETTPIVEVTRRPWVESTSFSHCYVVHGTPNSLALVLTEELRDRIHRLELTYIELEHGELVVTKRYPYRWVDKQEIRDAIILAADLVLAAQASPTRKMVMTSAGSPYRGHPIAKEQATELAMFERRRLKRRRSRQVESVRSALLITALVVAWPIGLGVLIRRAYLRRHLS